MTAPKEAGATRTRTVQLPGGLAITCLEAASADEALERAIASGAPPPYGAVLWASAVAVAEHLAGRADLEGMRVLDVGSGNGLCALVAAKRGAHVLALDLDPFALELVAEAARRQALSVTPRLFDLGGDSPLPEADLVLFADLLYEEPLARAAAARVLEAARAGAEVLVGDPERTGRAAFLDVLRQAGVSAGFIEGHVRLPGEERLQRVGLLHLPAHEVRS